MADVMSIVMVGAAGFLMTGLLGAMVYQGAKWVVRDVQNTSFVVRTKERKVRNADGTVLDAQAAMESDHWSDIEECEEGAEEPEEEVEKVPTRVELWQARVRRMQMEREERETGLPHTPGLDDPRLNAHRPRHWSQVRSPLPPADPPGELRVAGRFAQSHHSVDSPSQNRIDPL